ncbi:glycosyltransferase [Iningainema tapete]|uniref:Glycosyltransferase n=1 Tax=Iningainema tapete BLCC-T55 TaxID=2748662 RepID=A0A8J6XN79_9CYAN|nr:glycosyltransferase [Iningainema tapete]MBD2778163.1 glycosyltransferase [Iningainema tapete BLCC-T55]
MNNKPLVSSIIIFLNGEKFLVEAIESIFAQTYDHWELLLVDDGSTDSSTKIALQYAEKFPEKVRYLEHEGHQNRGMSATRNLGISKSKGKYIALLDADDVWLPQKLEQQVAILESHPEAALVYGQDLYWHSWTGKYEDLKRDFMPDLGIQPNKLYKPRELLTLCYPLGEASAPCPSGFLTKREAIEKVGGFEEAFRGMYEDQAFLVKVYLHFSVYVANECWDKYRLHPDSCSSNVERAGKYHSARLFFLNWFANYVSQQGVKDPKINQALQKALLPYRYQYYQVPLFVNQLKTQVKQLAKQLLPAATKRWLGKKLRGEQYIPPVGVVDLGSLRRVTPMSRAFGFDRGLPVDRYYIENFLTQYQKDIQGHVLEIGDDEYTRTFGGDRLTKVDILHVTSDNPKATIISDLAYGENIPTDTFDCFILTQTLQLIYDVRSAIKTVHRILKPGGVALVTVPGISHIGDVTWGNYWLWGFTALSVTKLFEEFFPAENLQIETDGNVLTAASFLYGLSAKELRKEELDSKDPCYQVIISIRAEKPKDV